MQSDTPLYQLDFETEGLNPITDAITSAAIYEGTLDGSSRESIASWDDRCEERLLLNVRDFFESPWTKPGVIVTWNGSGFDIPFYVTRTQKFDIPLWRFHAEQTDLRPPKYKPLTGHVGGYALQWKDHTHADIFPAFAEYQATMGISGKLKETAKSLDIDMIEVDAARAYLLSPSERNAYNVSDTHGTLRLAQRINSLYEEGLLPHEFDHYLDSELFEEHPEWLSKPKETLSSSS